MAVKLMTTIYRWNGITSDAKPSSGVPEGSTFHNVDTGEEYIYHDGMWEDDLRLRNAKSGDLAVQVDAVTTYRATGAAAIALTVAPSVPCQLCEVRVHLGGGGAATSLTVTVDSGSGPAYDVVVYTVPMSGVTDVIKTFDPAIEAGRTDKFVVAYGNGGAETYGVEVKVRER